MSTSTGTQKKKYPADFVKAVKDEYPDWELLHKYLDEESDSVSLCLDDARKLSMSPDDIVLAFKEGLQSDVLEAAETAVRREKLYRWYNEIYSDWKKSKRQ
ncbi:hypothetical protein BMS3Abin15_00722 [bacterium BMS3Abin15]|nr:hypothetical protein BMS3Abin15_00722 [bacterium BMS3Abin15]HDZ85933.1 hypothetical protein [Candidatus Moranbacteria bacterium]